VIIPVCAGDALGVGMVIQAEAGCEMDHNSVDRGSKVKTRGDRSTTYPT
jgi:hypothetical protein